MERLLSFYILLFIVTTPFSFLAQEKLEMESRLNNEEVPESALLYVDSISPKNKVKWYLDESINFYTYEAKFVHRSKRHSVEFDSLGNLQDVEVEVEFESLPSDACSVISDYLKNDNQRYKIKKVQIQYSGTPDAVLDAVNDEDSNKHFVRYELVVKCKKDDEVHLYEYLFDADGRFMSIAKILPLKASNIEY
ncbi:MAG: hypothetical protein NXI10_16405 [bacterium]|nr:hypothetical protein [bacterium]